MSILVLYIFKKHVCHVYANLRLELNILQSFYLIACLIITCMISPQFKSVCFLFAVEDLKLRHNQSLLTPVGSNLTKDGSPLLRVCIWY